MSRKIVALAALALTAALIAVPDPSVARGGGMRGGFSGARGHAFIPRHVRTLPAHIRTQPIQFRHPALPHVPNLLARTTVRAPFVHLSRRSHGAYIYGSTYPITGEDEGAYFGVPYDPAADIPVYGPAPLIQNLDPALPPPPRLTGMRDENQEACRSERVTVPATEGERDILVVRC
jgi:hypothetical protein